MSKAAGGTTKFKLPTTSVVLALIASVFSLAAFRFFISDTDSHKCQSLLEEGRWLSPLTSWQPQGCMLNSYSATHATQCLAGRQVLFIGDSTVRQVFFAAVKHIDPLVDTTGEKHSDRDILVRGIQFNFYWDPFLNETKTAQFLAGKQAGTKPTLAVLGSGLWYLRQSSAGGIPQWKKSVDSVFAGVEAATGSRAIADEVILLPVEHAVEKKMSAERAATVHLEDIKSMNEYLAVRQAAAGASGLAIPTVFNKIIAGLDDQTEDGLHFSDAISKVQASIIYNLRCNDVMPKKFPFDKTCCSQYPLPNWVQVVVLFLLLGWAPLGLYLHSKPDTNPTAFKFFPDEKYLIPSAIFGFSVSFLFVADRTSLFLKENKQYDALTFAILCGLTLAGGLATMKPAEKDLGFLNREQTDEWKGWMQIVILIYHYLGASKISGIYNPVRVLVAAYLFMSGYGHLSFFLKKADYGFSRVANILIRLNLLVVVLAYIMDTDYLSYYFSPLVTIWFLVIWVTMWAGHQYNERTSFLVAKLCFAAIVTAAYFTIEGPLEGTFKLLNLVFATSWNAKEWRFRVALDMWIVWGGMGCALAFIKIKELRITDRPEWAKWQRWAIIASAVTMVGYFVFELTRKNKFVYNVYHPYISIFPVLAYAILRNATPYLRSTSSKFFIFFGQCSLETFILQFYIFLSADTKGIIMLIPGGPWLRPLNFIITSLIFVFVSNEVAKATGALTAWVCSQPARLPTVAPAPTTEYIALSVVDGPTPGLVQRSPPASPTSREGKELPAPLEETSKSVLTKVGDFAARDLRVKFGLIILGLWALNWVYPA